MKRSAAQVEMDSWNAARLREDFEEQVWDTRSGGLGLFSEDPNVAVVCACFSPLIDET